MEMIAILSLTIPMYEPAKMSYMRNDSDTGTDIILVRRVFLSHSDTVTNADAVIGRRLMGDLKERILNEKLSTMKKTGHNGKFAHFLSSRFTNTSSLNIPERLGIMPPNAPKSA